MCSAVSHVFLPDRRGRLAAAVSNVPSALGCGTRRMRHPLSPLWLMATLARPRALPDSDGSPPVGGCSSLGTKSRKGLPFWAPPNTERDWRSAGRNLRVGTRSTGHHSAEPRRRGKLHAPLMKPWPGEEPGRTRVLYSYTRLAAHCLLAWAIKPWSALAGRQGAGHVPCARSSNAPHIDSSQRRLHAAHCACHSDENA